MGQAESTPGQNGAATHPEALASLADDISGIDINHHANGGKTNNAPKQQSRMAQGRQFSQKSIRNFVPSRSSAPFPGNSQNHGATQPPQHHGEQANPIENGHHPALHQEYEKRTGRRQQQPLPQFSSKQQQQQYEYQQQQQYEQQQYYYQQQQQQRQSKKQPLYDQQQRGQQMPHHFPRYAANSGEVIINPRPPLGPPGQQHKVDVMYAFEGSGSSKSRGGVSAIGGGSGPPLPSAGQVPSLPHQMQNLSMYPQPRGDAPGVASVSASAGMGKFKTTGLGLGNDEDKWKTAWDDDDESSGGEDGPDDDRSETLLPGPPPRNSLPPPPSSSAAAAAVHQPFRPSMDGGHSSSSPIKRPVGGGVVGGDHGVSVSAASSTNVVASQQQHPSSRPPPLFPSTGAAVGGAVSGLALRGSHVANEDILLKEADKVLQEGDNGMRWDISMDDDKPSVKMFFPLLRVLGKGSFGKVVLVQKRTGRDKGGLFAMKILRKAHLLKRRQIDRTKTERKVLSIVDHPFIMKLHFAFQTEDKLYLVLDYCPGGELFFHLSRYRKFPERVARFYAAELLLAMGHLHKKGIIYRDLKPENVLLDAEGHVKLGDFGLAKDRIKHPCQGATSMCGTPEYMAPEVLQQMGHGFCVDYWGLGMLVYEMMTGLPPWYTTDRTKLFKRLKGAPLEFPQYFSPHARSFVSDLLERNPRRRLGVLGARSVMEHDFFRSMDFRALIERRIDPVIRPCEGWRAPEPENERNNDSKNVASANAMNASTSAPLGDKQEQDENQISSHELEAATENFDKTFTRMPVNTEDTGENEGQQSGDEGGSEVLHENTFVGFTFDEGTHDKKKFGFPSAPGSSPQAYGSRRN
mmetsp:Transcript_69078/g.102640  ORF Transcript_69078/g.102640 Transcript_69078/m.102640 type:complete len:858 (-) Transcript_69078:627-3200(-)